MKLERFKERNNKMIGVILFTIICILLIGSVILYKTFASFEVNHNFNIINGTVQEMGDLKFLVYVNGKLEKNVPSKESGYTLNTEKSKCENGNIVSWNQERWSVEIKTISTTKTKCYLYFEKLYEDPTLNGAIPDLGNELIAITFDNEGRAIKADLTKPWYDYSKQEWANAVILRTKEEYEDGTLIPEENIESYFVWIPRYRYELWNGVTETSKFTGIDKDLGSVSNVSEQPELNKARKINIIFETKENVIQKGNNKGEYLTHPAFVSFNSNGFWIGKFETGYNQDPEGEEKITPDNWNVGEANKDVIASNRIVIKPNIYSWRSIRVANAFYTVYEYKRNLDSHMMKNTEWGAVAYLTNSKYGRCKDDNCEEVRINNSINIVTGNSAVHPPTCGYTDSSDSCNIWEVNFLGEDTTNVNNYNNSKSVASSTTGNYTGVYDMSGGAWDYVMGVMQDQEGSPTSGRNNNFNSNFIGTLTYPTDGTEPTKTTWTETDGGLQWPDKKYYDTYDYAETDQTFNRGLFGDATKEVGPFYLMNSTKIVSEWNADDAFFIAHAYPWFVRGGSAKDGTDAGIFASYYGHGQAADVSSFRIILTP